MLSIRYILFLHHTDLASYPSRKSPFLHPIAASLLDEDVEDLVEEEENAHLEFLDDDEAQLQAAIASSLGQPYQVPERILDQTYRTCEMDKESQKIPEDVQRITKLREDALLNASHIISIYRKLLVAPFFFK